MKTILQAFPEIIKKDFPLSKISSFKIGGKADLAAFPRTKEEFSQLIRAAKEQHIRTLIVGLASNLLFDDTGFRGLVIFTIYMNHVIWKETSVTADAGTSLTALAWEAAKRGLSGLEFAYGIPGTVGGAVYMNAGAYGGDIAGVLTESTCLHQGSFLTLSHADHHFSYRKSIYSDTHDCILSASFALTESDACTVQALCEERMNARKSKQPLEFPSAGSTFKRPDGYFAGALIEQCGLKGYRIGGAEVSEKHAGFLINRGTASAQDVRTLIEYIQKNVFERFGVHLETEVIDIGP